MVTNASNKPQNDENERKNVAAAVENVQLREMTTNVGTETPKRKNDDDGQNYGDDGRNHRPKRAKKQLKSSGQSTQRHVIKTKDQQEVEVILTTITLQITFDNGLFYQMDLTRPVGADEMQVLLNRIKNNTVIEFRQHIAPLFSYKSRKLAKAGNTRPKPSFTFDAKLRNFKDLYKQRFEICNKLDAILKNTNNLGCPKSCKDDCIEFTLESKRVVITIFMSIEISLPTFGLEYEIKLTKHISSDELINLLRFVDESGKEQWEDLAKQCSEAPSETNNGVVDLCIPGGPSEPNASTSNQPEPFYETCRREMIAMIPQWKKEIERHCRNQDGKPQLTKVMMKNLLEKMERYCSNDDAQVRSLPLPSINYDVLKELRWWSHGEEVWLNDKIINAYLELICARSGVGLPRVHAMNTHFLTALSRNGEYNHNNVHDWTDAIDIFAFDLVLVPVHLHNHWCMSIIYMKEKTVKYYDSMGGSGDGVLTNLLNYLKDEHRCKFGIELDSDWNMLCVDASTIPQQDNEHDCGVFACMYAEFVTRNYKPNHRGIRTRNQTLNRSSFSQNDMEYFRKKMAYELCVSQKLLAYPRTH